MLTYPEIDPVVVSLGSIQVHWYGVMYLLGFSAAWLLATSRSKRAWSPLRRDQVEDLIVYAAFVLVSVTAVVFTIVVGKGMLPNPH